MGDEKSLAHTRWNCKYHIVFAPKYRRQAFYGEKRRAVGSILRKLCEWKNVRILEAILFKLVLYVVLYLRRILTHRIDIVPSAPELPVPVFPPLAPNL
ncbi:transposase for insertion sequence element IS200 [Salmonella enterica subsp. enterica serovar Typhi]|nr:transposase for insertion sequence element IS200 [Salmonella enterica subsp. enterica serovar Typhi]